MGLKAKLQEKATPAQPAKLKVLPFPARREGAPGAGVISQEALTEWLLPRREGAPGAGVISQEALTEWLLLRRAIREAIAALKKHDEYLRQWLAAGYSVEPGAFDVKLNRRGRVVVR